MGVPHAEAWPGLIPPGTRVIEFGAGQRRLQGYLDQGCTYVALGSRGAGARHLRVRSESPAATRPGGACAPTWPCSPECSSNIRDVPSLVEWLSERVTCCVASYALTERTGLVSALTVGVRPAYWRTYHGYMNSYSEPDLLALFARSRFACLRTYNWNDQAACPLRETMNGYRVMTEPGFIPVAAPVLDGNEKTYVLDCLESTWISSSGKYLDRFEEAFAEFCGVKHAVSCSNGTTALHLALLALDVGPGDEVIVPTLTFVATANAVTYCGARPVFVDVEAETWSIDPAAIEAKITPRTKGIIAVHLFGHPADMEAIGAIARRHGLFLARGRRPGARGRVIRAGGPGPWATSRPSASSATRS